MIFRKAELRDCNAVYSLYRTLAGRPLCTWDAEYPGWLQINEDYESGGLYVMAQDEGIVGAISIVPENELDALPFWRFQNAREIARVAVAPDQQGKGIGFQMTDAVCLLLQGRCVSALHLLVSPDNIPAQRIYRRCGFDFLERCQMFGLEFIACEKPL